MAEPRSFTPEKLITAVLISVPSAWEELIEKLSEEFGELDFRSDAIPFTFTRYYDAEMGTPIVRRFVAFRRLVPPNRLADIKMATNSLENRFRERGKRRINLDPGLLALSRLVLATTKEGSHRIALRDGIYAEVTLLFERGDFRSLPWTYPDYRTDRYREVLREIRRMYKSQLGGRP